MKGGFYPWIISNRQFNMSVVWQIKVPVIKAFIWIDKSSKKSNEKVTEEYQNWKIENYTFADILKKYHISTRTCVKKHGEEKEKISFSIMSGKVTEGIIE